MDAYIGEIRMWPGTKAPTGWQLCDGTKLLISSYEPLFALIGITYGGDGTRDFAIPDLRGKVPIHQGAGTDLTPRLLAQTGGATTVLPTVAEMPAHTHNFVVTTATVTAATPVAGMMLATAPTTAGTAFYMTDTAGETEVNLNPASIGLNSGGQTHPNVMPTTQLNYIISLVGTFPTKAN